MIAHLSGTITSKSIPFVVMDVGGVGYEVEVSLSTFAAMPELGQNALIYIQMIVREDAQRLYGFAELGEKRMFQTLIKINGVGAKMALAILSSMSSAEFAQTIHDDNVLLLTKIPGVGKKTAERLIVEMKDKISQFDDLMLSINPASSSEAEAIAALEALGYKPADAKKQVQSVAKEAKSVEEIIRMALQ